MIWFATCGLIARAVGESLLLGVPLFLNRTNKASHGHVRLV